MKTHTPVPLPPDDDPGYTGYVNPPLALWQYIVTTMIFFLAVCTVLLLLRIV